MQQDDDNTFKKRYYQTDLLYNQQNLQKRINLINNFKYCDYEALVPTKIKVINNTLEYTQKKVYKQKPLFLSKKSFHSIVNALEYFESIGFVHGDINRRNIMYTNNGFKIIDYEPELIQNKKNITQLIITIPYVSKKEYESKILTSLSDKIAFCYFILRVLNKISSKQITGIKNTLNHFSILGLTEDQIKKTSYRCLLDKFYDYL